MPIDFHAERNHRSYSGRNAHDSWHIARFDPADQAAARMLVLTGLGEHFGYIDYTLNPDLDDIQQHYVDHGHMFLVAKLDNKVIATGALKDDANGTGRLVRISVKKDLRRSGIGSQVVRLLLHEAVRRQYKSVYLTTIPAWTDAIGLYQSLDFHTTELTEEQIRMELVLPGVQPGSPIQSRLEEEFE